MAKSRLLPFLNLSSPSFEPDLLTLLNWTSSWRVLLLLGSLTSFWEGRVSGKASAHPWVAEFLFLIFWRMK